MDIDRLARLRNRILNSDNADCFIERETILYEHAKEVLSLPSEERYLAEFQLVLDNITADIDPDDVFAGRMIEGKWTRTEPFSYNGLNSEGHITIRMPDILQIGLKGLMQKISRNADRIQSEEARYFERQAKGCIETIRRFCNRYADAADRLGKTEMAKALRTVPYEPAYDLFSALQSIWMMQFVCSTVCGARDFAPGRIDQYLLPYCEGHTKEEIVSLFAFFLMKFNEITGTATDNYAIKPTPCFSSKQYLTLGPDFNEVTGLLIEAAKIVKMPQPTLNFRLDKNYELAGQAAFELESQCNFFNEQMTLNKLLNAGIEENIAENYTFTACNRVDLNGMLYNKMTRIDCFDNPFVWFRLAMFRANDVEEIPDLLYQEAYQAMLEDTRTRRVDIYSKTYCFHLESIFMKPCVQTCRDVNRGGADGIRWQHRMFSGLANMADSMAALEILRKRFSYKEILTILDNNFEGQENLRAEILNTFPKYGNGNPSVDKWATVCGNRLIDAFEDAARTEGFVAMPSFYSLTRHAAQGQIIGATPDGRKNGETISENQSPVHNMDRNGPTSLLKSVSALPLSRCICGGLNLKFGSKPSAAVLTALIRSFFQMGGLHIGFSFADRQTLEDARKHPENYRTLLVRKTGFSEFFVSLSPEEMQEIIDRTEY